MLKGKSTKFIRGPGLYWLAPYTYGERCGYTTQTKDGDERTFHSQAKQVKELYRIQENCDESEWPNTMLAITKMLMRYKCFLHIIYLQMLHQTTPPYPSVKLHRPNQTTCSIKMSCNIQSEVHQTITPSPSLK